MAQQQSGPINGLDPLIYTGSLPNMVIKSTRPTPMDGRDWPFGYFWMIPTPNPTAAASPSNELWVLVGKKNNICKWIKLLGTTESTGNIIKKTYIRTPGAGVFIPHPSMIQVSVEIVGGGGSSTAQISDGTNACSIPGGGGAYCIKYYSKDDIGASQNYFVGAGGQGNNSGGAQEGVDGQATTFMGMTAAGGKGGTNVVSPIPGGTQGGAGGIATGGDLNVNGINSLYFFNYFPNSASYKFYAYGFSGASFYGTYGSTQFSETEAAGLNGRDGSGGGAVVVKSATDRALASNGGDGLIIFTEYLG